MGVFAIGPSTALGRALALRVLLCGSLGGCATASPRRCGPRSPWRRAGCTAGQHRGILLAVCAVALLLRVRAGRRRAGSGRGAVRVPAQVLAEHDARRAHLRGVGARRADAGPRDPAPRHRRRPLRRGARAQQAPRAQAPPPGGLAQGHRLLHARRPAQESRQHVQLRAPQGEAAGNCSNLNLYYARNLMQLDGC